MFWFKTDRPTLNFRALTELETNQNRPPKFDPTTAQLKENALD